MREPNFDASPKISAIILCYNHRPYIQSCIESIIGCQTTNTEILVLDDCSPDGSADLVRHMVKDHTNIRLLVNDTNTSDIAANTQMLIDHSTGPYILFMAGDDMLAENYGLINAVSRLQTDPSIAMVIPRLTFMMKPSAGPEPKIYDEAFIGALRSSDPREILKHHLFKRVSRLFLQGALIRRSIIEEMGGFSSGTTSDDYAFFMRLFHHLEKTGRSFYFDEMSTWRYRIHTGNIHRNAMRQFSSILEVVTGFVPEIHWRTFVWDSMVFTTYEDLTRAVDMAREKLGAKNSKALVRTISRRAISAAAKRQDRAFLSTFIRDRRNSPGVKFYAVTKMLAARLK